MKPKLHHLFLIGVVIVVVVMLAVTTCHGVPRA